MGFLTNPKVQRHEVNARGRDFIVGDLHGCRSMLDTMLFHVGFDRTKDRLFSTGDLVDRGPDSEGCLELLREPWFYPVLGNHDAMLIAWIYGGRIDARCRRYEDAFVNNKGWKWVRRFTRSSEFLPLLEQVPLVLVVGSTTQDSPSERFHVAHAELLGSSLWSDALLDAPKEEQQKIWSEKRFIAGFDGIGDGIDAVLWGRELRICGDGFPDRDDPTLSTTYVGHTITVLRENPPKLLRRASHVFLDTGAYRAEAEPNGRHGLSLWCHQERRGWHFDRNTFSNISMA